jgi:hypothetical protein
MEAILKELNMTDLVEKFTEKHVSVKTFEYFLKPSVSGSDSSDLKRMVMQDCGINIGQFAEICEKVEQMMIKEKQL